MVVAGPGNESPFEPSSPFAGAIAHLFEITLVACGVIGVGVTGAIVYSLFAFRARPGAVEPGQRTGNGKIEALWIGGHRGATWATRSAMRSVTSSSAADMAATTSSKPPARTGRSATIVRSSITASDPRIW